MSKTGTRAPNGSGTKREDGYWQIKLPEHPVSGARGLAFVHRVTLYDKIGPGTHKCYYCPVEVTWFVDLECDHLDHNKDNNDPDNLVACCRICNRARWNRRKTGCPKEEEHGPYDKQYANGHRYCSKCKNEKEKRRTAKRRALRESVS